MKRYELLGPNNNQLNSVSIWNKCLDNAKSKYNYELNREINLLIYKKAMNKKWIDYNKKLKNINKNYENYLKMKQKTSVNINKQRKLLQTKYINSLNELQNNWYNIVNKNNQIQLQCALMEQKKNMLPKKFKQSKHLKP